MYQGITTVALYDTLGDEAIRFVLNQTELTTMAISVEFVPVFAKMKMEDIKLNPNE
jgi:long-subunit acyl-CoA synthetase (AMP-forming)